MDEFGNPHFDGGTLKARFNAVTSVDQFILSIHNFYTNFTMCLVSQTKRFTPIFSN